MVLGSRFEVGIASDEREREYEPRSEKIEA